MNNENIFVKNLKEFSNITYTTKGALACKSTLNKVYDMFALGGAYRARTDEDCILLFKNALEENEDLALKCLFYLRDIRGGQGERRFFRVCFRWLAQEYPEIAKRNLINLAEYGRYDDLYCVVGTPIEKDMFALIEKQLLLDITSYKQSPNTGISLLAKWIKSENASSEETKRLANKTREALGLSHKDYRQILSKLRARINIVENLMSHNKWSKIEYDKIPSKAGLIYRNAFAKRDADRYKEFINNKTTKVNAGTLFPYEIIKKVTENVGWWSRLNITDEERVAINKYWDNQKDYFNGQSASMLSIIDTSGSMTKGCGNVAPIDVAISLGIYAAERNEGPFKNMYISFASRPQLIEIKGIDFVDKVRRIYDTNLIDNTNLTAVFNLLKDLIIRNNIPEEHIPKTLVVISDMEIDKGSYWKDEYTRQTEMARVRKEWNDLGLKMPHICYWNVNARQNVILEDANNDGVTYVSGCSPSIYESILTGRTGIELMLDKLIKSGRYDNVK